MPKELKDALSAMFDANETFASWTPWQRRQMLRHLINFLELKVILEDNIPGVLLSPSHLVDVCWHAVILETRLYRTLTCALQAHFGKARVPIDHSVLTVGHGHATARVRRTIDLYKARTGTDMPFFLPEARAPQRFA